MTKEDYFKRINKNKKKNYKENIIKRTLITSIIVLIILIVSNLSSKFSSIIKKELLEKNYNFSKLNSLYKKYILSINPIKDKSDTSLVSSNKVIDYLSIENYMDGVKLIMNENTPISMLESGLVVYVGVKEEYGMSVVVKQNNGIDVIYGNVDNVEVKVYDYVEKDSIFASSKSELILIFEKDGEKLDYKEFI